MSLSSFCLTLQILPIALYHNLEIQLQLFMRNLCCFFSSLPRLPKINFPVFYGNVSTGPLTIKNQKENAISSHIFRGLIKQNMLLRPLLGMLQIEYIF